VKSNILVREGYSVLPLYVMAQMEGVGPVIVGMVQEWPDPALLADWAPTWSNRRRRGAIHVFAGRRVGSTGFRMVALPTSLR